MALVADGADHRGCRRRRRTAAQAASIYVDGGRRHPPGVRGRIPAAGRGSRPAAGAPRRRGNRASPDDRLTTTPVSETWLARRTRSRNGLAELAAAPTTLPRRARLSSAAAHPGQQLARIAGLGQMVVDQFQAHDQFGVLAAASSMFVAVYNMMISGTPSPPAQAAARPPGHPRRQHRRDDQVDGAALQRSFHFLGVASVVDSVLAQEVEHVPDAGVVVDHQDAGGRVAPVEGSAPWPRPGRGAPASGFRGCNHVCDKLRRRQAGWSGVPGRKLPGHRRPCPGTKRTSSPSGQSLGDPRSAERGCRALEKSVQPSRPETAHRHWANRAIALKKSHAPAWPGGRPRTGSRRLHHVSSCSQRSR